MRLGLPGLWPIRGWELPKAGPAPWNCLTQSGRAPQVGTRWQRSRRTLMTITQGCRPLALAFGERSTWLAPGSCKHVAKGGMCTGPREQGLIQGQRAQPGVEAVRDSGRHGPAGLTVGDRKQTPFPNGPRLSPSAGRCGPPPPEWWSLPSGSRPNQPGCDLHQVSAGRGHVGRAAGQGTAPPTSVPHLYWEPALGPTPDLEPLGVAEGSQRLEALL